MTMTANDELGVTADWIAYKLARELEDLIELAAAAMRQANMDGAEYEVEDELASARLAIAAYQTFHSSTKGDVARHSCQLNRAYDGSCFICESAKDDA